MTMLNNTYRILVAIIACACFTPSFALDSRSIRFHDMPSDTARINSMLVETKAMRLPTPGDNVAAIGRMLLDTPYVGHTLEGDPEQLTVNLDELDCTTFVETCFAMALSLREGRDSWRDFTHNLQRVRYRNGEINGYPSRLHYICDWSIDNIHRGNLTEVTQMSPKCNYIVRTINFMTDNADKYAALADSANLAGIRSIEANFRSHRFPYIKTGDLQQKGSASFLHNGDILAFVTNLRNLDVTHMGIVVMENGEPHVMHASSSAGKVVISSEPLQTFLKKNRQFIGIRVFRIPS